MDFIIEKFLKMLDRDFKIKYKYFRVHNDFIIDLYDTSDSLKDMLLKLLYPSIFQKLPI